MAASSNRITFSEKQEEDEEDEAEEEVEVVEEAEDKLESRVRADDDDTELSFTLV